MFKKRTSSGVDSKKVPSSKKKISFWGIILAGLILFLVYNITARTIENFLLAEYGIIEKGTVTAKFKVGSKGIVRIEYRFSINNKSYEGATENEDSQIGETINILYLSKMPTINRTYSFIKENYKTGIKAL